MKKESIIGKYKYCKFCKNKFYYKKGEGKRDWNKRQFCCKTCRNQGWRHTKKAKEKISKALSLEKHPFWKEGGFHKGKTLLKILERNGVDTTKCQECGKIFGKERKDVHHIDKNPLNNNLKNLMVVCRKCHKKLDGYGFYTELAKKEGKAISTVWANFDYKKNPEKYKEKNRINYQKHKGKRSAHNKEYYQKNKDKIKKRNKEYGEKYYQKNKEKIKFRKELRNGGN